MSDIKDRVQKLGAKLGVENKHIMIQLPTGVGKGKLCMMIIDQAPTDRKWLVVVPELIQIENMRNDIKKHGFEHLYKDKIQDIVCYASLGKYMGAKLNLHFNECHRLSELKEDFAHLIDSDRIIADSATIPEAVRERFARLGKFFEFRMDLKEAVEAGLLPEPAVHVMYTALDDVKKDYKYLSRENLTEREYLYYLEKDMGYWMGRSAEEGYPTWIGNKIKQLGGLRKKFVAHSKTDRADQLVASMGSKKTLIYTGSLEQCDELGGLWAVHSKKGKKHNLKVLDDFNNNRINRIYLNKMGREGLNLEGIRAVVLVQLGSGRDEGLELIQKMGRGLRADFPEIYIIVCKDTMDEKYLKKALENLDKNKIKYI